MENNHDPEKRTGGAHPDTPGGADFRPLEIRSARGVARGAYIMVMPKGKPQVILMATGS